MQALSAIQQQIGDWIEMHVDTQRLGKSLSLANGYLKSAEGRIARASGVYRNLRQVRQLSPVIYPQEAEALIEATLSPMS